MENLQERFRNLTKEIIEHYNNDCVDCIDAIYCFNAIIAECSEILPQIYKQLYGEDLNV
jgi:hypothetical protein